MQHTRQAGGSAKRRHERVGPGHEGLPPDSEGRADDSQRVMWDELRRRDNAEPVEEQQQAPAQGAAGIGGSHRPSPRTVVAGP
jgi:hypothetical protein